MKKSAQKQKNNSTVPEGIFSQDPILYSRTFYFFGVFALLLVFFSFLTFFLYFLAEPTEAPQDVLVTDIAPTSITLSWKTDRKTKGLVIYTPATTPRLLRPIALLSLPGNLRAYDQYREPTNYHTVTLTNLLSNTSYLYRVSTGIRTYKIDGQGKLLPGIKTIQWKDWGSQ